MDKKEIEILFSAAKDSQNLSILDLHGRRVFEVENLLDEFLNSEYMAESLYVKILCGLGTGAIIAQVEKLLRQHYLVLAYRAVVGGSFLIVIK